MEVESKWALARCSLLPPDEGAAVSLASSMSSLRAVLGADRFLGRLSAAMSLMDSLASLGGSALKYRPASSPHVRQNPLSSRIRNMVAGHRPLDRAAEPQHLWQPLDGGAGRFLYDLGRNKGTSVPWQRLLDGVLVLRDD